MQRRSLFALLAAPFAYFAGRAVTQAAPLEPATLRTWKESVHDRSGMIYNKFRAICSRHGRVDANVAFVGGGKVACVKCIHDRYQQMGISMGDSTPLFGRFTT